MQKTTLGAEYRDSDGRYLSLMQYEGECTHTYAHTHMHTHAYTHIHTHARTHAIARIHTLTHARTHTQHTCVQLSAHIYISTAYITHKHQRS